MFIKDMFFFHEHARKINIWSGAILLSPFMGPLLAAFIVNTQIWQWAFGIYAIETGLCLITIILFVDETYYDRKTAQPDLVPNGPRWQRMLGIQQFRSGYAGAVEGCDFLVTPNPKFYAGGSRSHGDNAPVEYNHRRSY